MIKLVLAVIFVMPQVIFGAELKPIDTFARTKEPAPNTVPPGSDRGLTKAYEKLLESGFQNIVLSADAEAGEIYTQLYHPRISEADRLVGRAARIIDGFAPEVFSKFNICYLEGGVLCSVCYDIDRDKLSRYYDRLLSRWQLRLYVQKAPCTKQPGLQGGSITDVRESGGGKAAEHTDLFEYSEPVPVQINGMDAPASKLESTIDNINDVNDPDVSAKRKDIYIRDGNVRADKRHLDYDLMAGFNLYQSNRLQVVGRPLDFGRYLNDADGDVFLDIQSSILLDAYLSKGWGLYGSVFYRWINSDDDSSDSELPHVRSDIDLYRHKNTVKVDELYVSYRHQVGRSGTFAAALGYQEEMFAGLSTQLYFPEVRRRLDIDISIDYLKQRETNESLSLMDYDVISALLGVNWRGAPYLNDIKLYAGRFLAKDSGARLDLGHRFGNGMRLAFWYSHTDGDDTTGPGSRSSPYRGRGVTFSIPLGGLRTKDTRRIYDFEYVPHLRDTAQMLDRPIDLSNLATQRALQDSGLRQFGQ